MAEYDWGIDGRRFDMNQPLDGAHEIREGERVRFTITNDTEMWALVTYPWVFGRV